MAENLIPASYVSAAPSLCHQGPLCILLCRRQLLNHQPDSISVFI